MRVLRGSDAGRCMAASVGGESAGSVLLPRRLQGSRALRGELIASSDTPCEVCAALTGGFGVHSVVPSSPAPRRRTAQ
eukprot:SAG31_NODE_18362_length_639_cov_0.762963_1_plen_78_part_00